MLTLLDLQLRRWSRPSRHGAAIRTYCLWQKNLINPAPSAFFTSEPKAYSATPRHAVSCHARSRAWPKEASGCRELCYRALSTPFFAPDTKEKVRAGQRD